MKDTKCKRQERLGKSNYNNKGYLMILVEYKDCHHIVVEFQDKYKARVSTDYKSFENGNVDNPYYPTFHNVGFIGQGKYKTKEKGKDTRCFKIWQSMIERCYSEKFQEKNPSYKKCIVCEKWHNFQNFADWFYENVYDCNNEKLQLDKDILVKGNKIYSPETCILVPQRINTLFIKCDKSRGKYPIGVTQYSSIKNNNKYEYLIVQCSIFKDETGKRKLKKLGYFPLSEPFHAFYVYKQFKENYIKQIADEYKDLIPTKLYEAMYRYEVEIND